MQRNENTGEERERKKRGQQEHTIKKLKLLSTYVGTWLTPPTPTNACESHEFITYVRRHLFYSVFNFKFLIQVKPLKQMLSLRS